MMVRARDSLMMDGAARRSSTVDANSCACRFFCRVLSFNLHTYGRISDDVRLGLLPLRVFRLFVVFYPVAFLLPFLFLLLLLGFLEHNIFF